MTEQKQQTTSAISDELESFLRAFKDREGNYKYFDRINNMMASNSTFVVVDYIDLDTNKPELTKLITDTPDEMFDAFNKLYTQYCERFIMIMLRKLRTR